MGTVAATLPKRRTTIAWSSSSRPIDATTFASIGAGAERPEDRVVEDQAEQESEQQGEQDRRDDLHVRTDRDPRGPVGEIDEVAGFAEPVDRPFDDHERIRQWRDEDVAIASEQRIEVRAVHRDGAVGEVDDAGTLVGQDDPDADRGDEGALDDRGTGQEVEPVLLVGDEEYDDDRGQTQQDPLGHLSDRALNDCPLCVVRQ